MLYSLIQELSSIDGREDVQVVQHWDDTTKRLIQSNPQHFVSWLLHGGVFKTYLATELKNWTLTADMMLQVQVGDHDMLLHLEIQSKEDQTMAQRLLEYNVLATREHKQPVLSSVLYLRKDRGIIQSPLRWQLPDGQETLAFQFAVIRLWDIPSREIIETGLSGLLPLLPLTREGQQRETIDLMIEHLFASQQQALLPLGEIIAGFVAKDETERAWLKGRFAMYGDIFEDSWVYQELMSKGMEKGIAQGMEQGMEKAMKQLLHMLLQRHFPDLLASQHKKIEIIKDPEVLQNLILKITDAKTAQEAQQAIDAVRNYS